MLLRPQACFNLLALSSVRFLPDLATIFLIDACLFLDLRSESSGTVAWVMVKYERNGRDDRDDHKSGDRIAAAE